ncbi:calcium channel [Dioszegia hungarica]|uniref:Calcium channel n=1 Tax=Dioszegia hungarica TaxID=4972 RepID=A0AA38HEY5_9TREE|nr:calcium channel [Dioszegia hungarica]KAI9638344.1 calcium channel [Dioszegia hungarica]
MSTRDRHSGRSRTGRPPERSQRSATSGWRVFAAVILLLSLVLPITSAQPSPSAPGPIQNLSIAAIPALINLTPLNSTRPTIQLSLPPTPDLFLTFNLCSLTSNSSLLPTVLISTAADPAWSLGARSTADSGSGGTREGGHNRRSRQGAVWSLVWDKGFGNWTMSGMGQGEQVKMLLSLDVDVNGAFRSGVGAGNMPTYPNYTLPPAQLPLFASGAGSSTSSLTLIIVPTGSSPTSDGLDNSLCAIRTANISTGGIASARNAVLNRSQPHWMRLGGEEGLRSAWGAGDLVAGGSNYTAWTLDEAKGELSRPVWFATKQAGFSCPLVLPTSFCPSIAYAAPLPLDPTSPTHPLSSLPSNITDQLTSNLNALSTSLLSTACGRDRYSFASSCADCHTAYRDWLCRVLIPRCAGGVDTTADPAPQVTRRTVDAPRVPGVVLGGDQGYDELLPCLSTCNAVDRACPVNLNFRCPLRKHGADKSYGFLGDDPGYGDGSADLGVAAGDGWGNTWCNP